MLAGGTDLLYREALAASHQPFFRVEVWRGTEKLESSLTYLSGSLSADLASRVVRTLDLNVTDDLYPYEVDDLLNPYGNYVKAFRGIEFADHHKYSWQVFEGRINRANLESGGQCSILCSDRANDVVQARFERPTTSQIGALVIDEFRRLISDAFPDARFGTSDRFDQRVPLLTWEHDRGKALDEMSTAVGAFWYPLANGEFVLRLAPWTVAGSVVTTFTDGPGGIVGESFGARSRESVFNSITVTGERADGTEPVFYTARDDNPNSPTFISGPFGVRNKLVQLNTPTTQSNARSAAETYLRHTTALTDQWSFTCVPDASLELGDVIGLQVRDQLPLVQVVESFDLPMSGKGAMTVRCRSQVLGALDELTGFENG